MFALKNQLSKMNEYSDQLFHEYYKSEFKGEEIPDIFLDFRVAEGMIVISNPDILQELLVTKGKYVDKYHRDKKYFQQLVGDSVLFDKSSESQASRRKRLSSAFYKDKMTQNLQIIIRKTFTWIEGIKEDIKNGNNERELNFMINSHILDCILMSVFGETQIKQVFSLIVDDKIQEVSLGVAVSRLFLGMSRKSMKPLRQFTTLFDSLFIGQQEKILEKNVFNFRELLQRLIDERKEKMKDPNFDGADFLTMLLTDDLFKEDESLMKDEIATFILASTLTTTALITNTLYYYEFLPEVKHKLRQEISQTMSSDRSNPIPFDKLKLTPEIWISKLGYDQLQEDWKYLYYLIQETMRIEPPVRSSIPMELNEKIQVCGYTIEKGIPITCSFLLLHRNPLEWQEPTKFIPERFDPESSYFLTPDGKKRKPFSFSPFLGGRRICLGKTFAENIAKCIVPMIVSELEFRFKKDYHYDRKPPKSFAVEINVPINLSPIQRI
ncbi:cytochrome p450 [Stylonychia lemnae]|uniref:Cytochrome p450 n=1 Tax=Stylonychia lemnae TaxID=5949 RepID=A0A078AMW1_STYLE|nr:cytochrome p450 [Stylonychia lemnae]|eukprot:CDW82712.1 cytochrome p450 [Stylonychia lemnae]